MQASHRIICVALLLSLAACGFEAPPPKRTLPPPAPKVPLSTLAATLVVPATPIIDTLNEKTRTEIVDIKDEPVDCTIAKCRLDLVATRTGPITGHAAEGRLSLAVPLAATAQLELKTPLFKTKADSSATGGVQSETSISLGPDWRVHADTHGSVELNRAQFKMGPVAMSFADIWNRNQAILSPPLFKILDRHVASSIKIRQQAERLWLKAQQPIRIGKSPAAWLLLEPERVRVSPLATHDNAVVVSFGVDVRARVVVADRPPAARLTRTIPPPVPLGAPSDRFAVVVPVLLPYGEAGELAMQRLAETPLKIGGARLCFERLEILPSGRDVVVVARFCVSQGWDPFGWFDSCGEGYLRGAPQFDSRTDTIRIANMHYDIGTEGMILGAVRMLTGDALSKTLEAKLVFNVGRDIGRIDAELQTALARPEGRGVVFSGNVRSFGVPTLTWTNEGFLATFPAQGTIHADLDLKNGMAAGNR